MKTPFSKSSGPDLVRAEREHAASITTLAEAEASLVRASEAYDAALGQGRDAALAARRAQGDAEVDRDVAQRAVERLTILLQAARDATAAAEIQRLSGVARERAAEFETVTRRELKAMSAAARRLMRLWADAQLARTAAVRAGADEAELPGVEDFRAVATRPREVIETRRVTRWIHPFTTEGLNDEQTAQLVVQGDAAYLRGGGEPMRLSHRAEFDRIVYVEREVSHRLVSVVKSLAIPGLMADEVPGWSPPDLVGPQAVLDHLAALEQAPEPDRRDRRERKVELRRVLRADRMAAAE